MTPRLLTLALSTALLTLFGCASQQAGSDPLAASDQRLSSLETRLQSDSNSTLILLDQLGRKVEALSTDLRRLRESTGEQAGAEAAARQALAERLARLEKQRQDMIEDNRATAAQVAGLQSTLATLRDQARETGQVIDRLAARIDHANTEQNLALEAETAELEDRLDVAEDRLEDMAARLLEGQTRTESVEAALNGVNETSTGNSQRLAALATRLDEVSTGHGALQASLTAKTDGNSQRLDALATQARSAQERADATQAALPDLRERMAAAGTRLGDLDARFTALNQRLDDIARMAQEAYDATGLGQRKIFGKVVESITLTEDRTLFPINSPDLGEQDKAKLDALAQRMKALGTNYHLQIQGHTEGFGADDYNYALGKARAEVVKNYLKEKGGIPLLRMSVMSYGSLEAAGQVGRNNRRIVVQVLQ